MLVVRAMTTLRFVALALFTVGMMFALHPLPREPWGVLGLGDLFTGYALSFVGGMTYSIAVLRRPRPRATVLSFPKATSASRTRRAA